MRLHWATISPAVIVLSKAWSYKQDLSNCSLPQALSRAQASETFGLFRKVKNEAWATVCALVSSDGKWDVEVQR